MASPMDNGRSPYYGEAGLMPKIALDRSRRTNTRLIRGPFVDIPPTAGLLTEPVLANMACDKSFVYKHTWDYNTASQGLVTLPKGHIIAFNSGGNIDFADINDNGSRINPIGLSYLNLFQPKADRLAANRPGVAIRGYFELPVFATYAAANAAGHKWGAILGTLAPGDYLRVCGSSADGANAPGWLTNLNIAGNHKLDFTHDPGTIIAQLFEFDSGPTFEGLMEWVQPEDPWEFEASWDYWVGADSTKKIYRDPNSPTGFSFDANGYTAIWPGPNFPEGQAQMEQYYWKDARGIPDLSDGQEWRTYQQDTIGGYTTGIAQTSVTFYFYYHTFGGVGMAMKRDDSAALNATTDIYDVPAATGGNTIVAWLEGLAAGTLTWSIVNDGKGTISVTAANSAPGPGAGSVTNLTIPAKVMYFLAKGQVAGVPVMIDEKNCTGLGRFQLQMK